MEEYLFGLTDLAVIIDTIKKEKDRENDETANKPIQKARKRQCLFACLL